MAKIVRSKIGEIEGKKQCKKMKRHVARLKKELELLDDLNVDKYDGFDQAIQISCDVMETCISGLTDRLEFLEGVYNEQD